MDKELEILQKEKQGLSAEDEVEAKDLELINSAFSEGQPLDEDVLNMWHPLFYAAESRDIEELNALESLSHYQQHYEEKNTRGFKDNKKKYGEEEAQKLAKRQSIELEQRMRLSDPMRVRLHDQLVDEFNADLKRIKKERDFQKLKYFEARAEKIVREKNKR